VYDVYTRSKEGMNSTCLEYSEMVKTFRRLIVQNVRVEDVLPSLQFLGMLKMFCPALNNK
jgi:hypothetical protein